MDFSVPPMKGINTLWLGYTSVTKMTSCSQACTLVDKFSLEQKIKSQFTLVLLGARRFGRNSCNPVLTSLATWSSISTFNMRFLINKIICSCV